MSLHKYSFFDTMIEGVQVINDDWEYIYVNNTAALQGQTTQEELLGKKMWEKYPGIESTEMFRSLQQCMLARIPHQMINEFNFQDGSKGYFDLRMEPVQEGVLIMSFDISRQKTLEAELYRLNQNLENVIIERTQELLDALEREKKLHAQKSNVASMASHEFKTPLSTILSSVCLLEQYTQPDQDALRTKHIERIKSSVGNMEAILGHFLLEDQMTHEGAEGKKQVFLLPEFASGIISELDSIMKTGQSIRYMHTGVQEVSMNKPIVRNVLLNLLSNAVKYSDTHIEFRTQADEKSIVLTVEDKGIGIPEEEQKNLFDRFFRARNAHNIYGTGLGLNIVKRYVEMLNGTIGVNSKLNEGTVFTVTLPGEIPQALKA